MRRTTLVLILLYCSHIPSSADNVFWLPDKNIKLAKNFENGQLPCSGQHIIFHDTIEEGILVSDLSISGLTLPLDGEFILQEGEIIFGPDPNDNCTRIDDTIYLDDSRGSWAQPDAWSSPRFNKATPDAERVPCFFDTAIFLNGSQFTIQLPDRPQTIESYVINGEIISGIQIEHNIMDSQTNDQSQQFIMSRPGVLQTLFGDKPQCFTTLPGCPCQEYALDIDCKLKYCPPPRCSYPIKPEGHCCELCGASLIVNITKDFNMKSFINSVNELIGSYGVDQFEYHIGLLPKLWHSTGNSERVQVIVMDKGEYSGACKKVITEIGYMIKSEDTVKGNVLLLSGNPSSESGESGKIVGVVFVLVVLTMSGLFGYYYRSSMRDLGDLRGGMTRGMLSRLQRRTESVMSLARRDSAVSSGTTTGTAFRNPMYSSMRERVQVVASVSEE